MKILLNKNTAVFVIVIFITLLLGLVAPLLLPDKYYFDANLIPGYWTGSNVDSSGGFEPNGVSIYNLYYHHTDANGCYNNDTLQINVIDPTNADAGIDQQMCTLIVMRIPQWRTSL